MKHILANTADDGLVFHETSCVVDGPEFRSTVSDSTREHERGYHELWARSGEFKTARGLVRALLNAQDLSSPSAVY